MKILFGERDSNVRIVEEKVGVHIHVRGNQITISGDEVKVSLAAKLLTEIYEVIKSGYSVYPVDIAFALRIIKHNPSINLKDLFLDNIPIATKRRFITPKSVNQKIYIDAMRKHDIVVAIGPAGTGKTYLAMALAIAALMNKEVERIILTRPAVEAGEKLGFLPG
ncbi:MAG TPA: PhoH family protein, partial [Thermodesulfobacteriota bacterium]|nr:PhoH family protein [Thermodesulfobacteriota bacterium]